MIVLIAWKINENRRRQFVSIVYRSVRKTGSATICCPVDEPFQRMPPEMRKERAIGPLVDHLFFFSAVMVSSILLAL